MRSTLILLSLAAFYLVTITLASDLTSHDLREQGWLFPKKSAEPFWSVWGAHQLGRVHWLRVVPSLEDTVGSGTGTSGCITGDDGEGVGNADVYGSA